jgi:hypothetical protein
MTPPADVAQADTQEQDVVNDVKDTDVHETAEVVTPAETPAAPAQDDWPESVPKGDSQHPTRLMNPSEARRYGRVAGKAYWVYDAADGVWRIQSV